MSPLSTIEARTAVSIPLVNPISFRHWQGDVFGRVTAAIVALALAFGVASGAGAIAGLYGAIFTGFFAALFGGTPTDVLWPYRPYNRGDHYGDRLCSRWASTF